MDLMEKITSLAKRRGFIFQSSEIYGGYQGFWDYGPAGVEMKNNIKKEWWKYTVYDREDVVGIDAAIIMNPVVWEKSGHLKAFTDPLIECKNCHVRFKADRFPMDPKDKLFGEKWVDNYRSVFGSGDEDDLVKMVQAEAESKNKGITKCPKCGQFKGYTEPKTFNLMTEVLLGTTEPKEKSYLRGEITQGAFVDFKNVVDSTRVRIPFGIAQIGKAFRNEITPGNLTFRSREFEQMELEYFVKPDEEDSKKTFEYWKEKRKRWYEDLGIDPKKLKFHDHEPEKRAHYAKYATDLEYEAPFGWSEFEGIHHRGDFDLSNHNLSYKDNLTGEEYTPWVIETSGGVDRAMLFFLIDAYREDGERVYLKLHPKIAPYKVAVFPLLANKPELLSKAKEIYKDLKQKFNVVWDDRGNIGKRYFAQDEIGTPWCVTVDFESLEDATVTVRDRDSAKQERIAIDNLTEYFQNKLAA